MKTQTEKLNVRDFVTIAILTVVELAIYFVIGMPLGSTPLSWIFCLGIQALPLGIVFMLMYTKVNKKGNGADLRPFVGCIVADEPVDGSPVRRHSCCNWRNYLGKVRQKEILHYADLLYHSYGRLVYWCICPADFAEGHVHCQPSHYGRI